MRELQEPAMAYSRDHSEVAHSWVDQQEQLPGPGKGVKRKTGWQQQGGHPKRDNKGVFQTNQEGVGICRNYSSDTCNKGSECQYTHQCSKCFGSHPKSQCTHKGNQKGKNKKGRGKNAGKGSH